MLMLLGMVAFALLVGSALLGGTMLIAFCVLLATRTWRRIGMIALGSGVVGALVGAAILFVLNHLLDGDAVSAEAWLLFAAAGFGWAGLLAV